MNWIKHLLFTLIIFALFFGGIELILALSGVKPLLLTEDPLVGFAGNVPLFVEQRQEDGTIIYKTANNKLTYFNDQEFPKAKDKNSYRIFSVGGSTTHGRPYDHRASFSGWLQAFLKKAESGRNWEVINAGGASYASYRVTKLMRELVHYQPDLFIVYTGHNEFLEERSYGKLTDLPSWVIEVNSMLNGTRIYSGMKRLYDSWQPDSLQQARKRYEVSGEVDTILSHTQGPTSYHRDDDLRHQILNHYRLNLERMVLLARDAGAEIIFVTPVVNLKDMSPFKSEHREGVTGEVEKNFNKYYERGNKLHAEGKFSEALDVYRQALTIDDRYAELHFQIGRVLFNLARFDEAEISFWHAVDEDVAPLRMLSAMQVSLVAVAVSNDVPLVDFQQILRQAYLQKYDHAVFGNEFFLDHVHTNMDGYRILGLDLFNQLIEQGVVSSDAVLDGAKVSQVIKQVTSSLSSSDTSLALFKLAKVLDWAGKFDEAQHLLLKNLESYGPRGAVYAQLGNTLAKKKMDAEAINYINQALATGYERPWMHTWLADTYRKQGNFPLAIKAYQDRLRLDNNSLEAHMYLGVLFASQSENESALHHFSEALRLKPDFVPAGINLVSTLFLEGQFDEALAKGQAILNNHPDEFRILYVVGAIRLRQGDKQKAIENFSEALRLAPDFKPAQVGLEQARKTPSN